MHMSLAESPRCIVLIVFREEVSHHKNEIQYSKWTIDEMRPMFLGVELTVVEYYCKAPD